MGGRLRRSAGVRASIVALAILSATAPRLSRAVDAAALRPKTAASPSNIVIGFVGGFVGHDNTRHGPVQLGQRIRQAVPQGTYVRVFENRRRKQAYDAVLALLDADRDGVLSAEEKTRAHIILFGHSWGASAAVLLARDLRRQGIPVLLTVQVDSVAKVWQNDSVIPDNVAEAVNFYQTQGIIHGRREITAADPARTEILGNYRMDYKTNPVACAQYPWFAHVFTPGHMQSECDPRLWSQIESMVRQRLSTEPTSAASISPTDHPQPTR
jgi:pimeloyl-ACP methyl ester carboxylesterase